MLGLKRSPFHQSPVGQPDAVLPQDVGHGQRDAHVAGDVAQPPVKLLKLLQNDKGHKLFGLVWDLTEGGNKAAANKQGQEAEFCQWTAKRRFYRDISIKI